MLPQTALPKLLVISLFLYPIATYLTNSDRLHYGPLVIPGLSIKDAILMEFNVFARLYVPFILAYHFLRTPESHKTFVKWIVVAGLLYTIPMLWEIRMSPQLHTKIYGFFPHDFVQQKRQGGFRPVVFLGHGLEVAMFMVMVMIGAISLFKAKTPPLDKWGLPKLMYLGVVVVLCKTMGALVYSVLAAPILLLMGVKWRVKAICIIAIFVFLFPILRGEQVIPLEPVIEFFQGIDPERAGSLKFRIDNEDQLLDKANERRYFGWGGWGRGRVYDPNTGRDLSVTDGFWIIIFGQYGWFGYISVFGLLCYPVIALYRQSRKGAGVEVPLMTVCLGVMLVFNLLDLLPNSSLTPITLLLAGAIQGWVVNRDAGKQSPLN